MKRCNFFLHICNVDFLMCNDVYFHIAYDISIKSLPLITLQLHILSGPAPLRNGFFQELSCISAVFNAICSIKIQLNFQNFCKWSEPYSHWFKPKSQTQYSPHKPRLCFLMRNDLYFHMGYAAKINFVSTHNIKFQKTEFSQKITSKIFSKVIFMEIHVYIHVFGPNSGDKSVIFFENLTKIFPKESTIFKIFCQIFEKN